ncbi:MAG: RagB/SusD family nutrient uptake outer membrane protein [Cyclobacteriaceae bacterium]|nr:RagB/SusD family nutrient uptake outer membrane protein [Cyclobacteriaceae bacterium]
MKKIYSIILVLAVMTFSSCSDWLEVQPRDIIDESRAFQSVEDLEGGVIGIYASLAGDVKVDVSSRKSDDLRLGDGNRGQGRQTHDWVVNSGTPEAGGYWLNGYLTIARANRVLSNIERLINEGVVTVEETNKLKGESLALRAFAHFNIWQMYGVYNLGSLAVPYVTLQDLSGNGIPDGLDVGNKPARPTGTEFFTFLFEDLNEAEGLLPAQGATKYRITKDAVIAQKARANLFRGNFAEAAAQAEDIIGRVAMATLNEVPQVWADVSQAGIIFALSRLPGESRMGTLFEDLNGDRFFQPAFGLVDLYDDTDIRRSVYFDDEGESVTKYPGTSAQPFLSDHKIFRVEEMYFISAEANARNQAGNLALANQRLNEIRSNRISGYEDIIYPERSDLLAEIILEKRKELVYEGHRFFDLKRYNEGLTRDPRDCTSGAIPCTVTANDYRWNFPVPQSEIFANPNIQQNEGYASEND